MNDFDEKDFDENAEFRLTPKGIAFMAMLKLGFLNKISESDFDDFWTLFEMRMKRSGYIEERRDE